MRAGLLRHKVVIERSSSTTRTDDGGFVPVWSELATAWAYIKPLSGREFLEAQQVSSDTSHTIWLRHDTDYTLSPRDRVVYGNRTFEIQSVMNMNEENRTVQLMVKERI